MSSTLKANGKAKACRLRGRPRPFTIKECAIHPRPRPYAAAFMSSVSECWSGRVVQELPVSTEFKF